MVQLGDGLLVALLDVLEGEGAVVAPALELAPQPLDLALARRHLLQRLRQLAARPPELGRRRVEARLEARDLHLRRLHRRRGGGGVGDGGRAGGRGRRPRRRRRHRRRLDGRVRLHVLLAAVPAHLVARRQHDAVLLEGLVEALAQPAELFL